MKLYRLRLRPLSPWRSLWQADTLAGMLCWACVRADGPEVLEREILGPARSGRPAFVLSDAFPGDWLPLPMFARPAASRFPGMRKQLRRAPWITREAFLRIQRGELVRPDDLIREAPLQRRVQLRNVLSRTTDVTRDGGELFSAGEWDLAAGLEHLTIYARVIDGFVPRLATLFHELGETGFGADASVGKGQFELLAEPEPDGELDNVPAADGTVVLSTFQPGAADPTDGAWRVFTKYGKLGPDFGVTDVFKRPLVMMSAGACFRSAPSIPFVGRLVPPEQLLSASTAAELEAQGIAISQLAFGLAVPTRWPIETERPTPVPTAKQGPEQQAATRRAAAETSQVLLLLDLEGSMPVEEIREHLPAGAEPRVFRLSDFGAPGLARTGPRPERLDWPAIRRAVLTLVQAARRDERDRRVHYVVHGMAPLPVFAYLGLLLSAWAGPITIINRRKDGTVDVCPMQGRRVGGELFDVVEGLDLDAPSTRPGRVAVFVSTGYLPEADRIRLFIESGGDDLAGLVQVRTSALRMLDRENTVAAADELARHLSLVPSAYPFQKGIALFIAGPAQLALAAGRAVNPTIITDVWIANRGGSGPSGHELAFSVSSTRFAEDDARLSDNAHASTPAERPRIEELRITGFRAFEQATLRLDDFTALIGRNGAGKSTLLKAFDFLREAVTDSLQNALIRQGGLGDLLPRLAAGQTPMSQEIGLAIVIRLPVQTYPSTDGSRPDQPEPSETELNETELNETELNETELNETEPSAPTGRRAIYGFRLTMGFEGGLQIEEQLLTDRGPGFRRLGQVVDSSLPAAALISVPRDGLLLPFVANLVPQWKMILDSISRIRVYTLSVARIRTPSPIGGGTALDREGGNIGEMLARLQRERADKDWIIRHLAAITPGVVDVEAGMNSSNQRMLYFDQRAESAEGMAQSSDTIATHSARRRFHAGEMSDGTLRALGILLACRQHPAPSLVLFDELEDSLHIGALHVILDALDATIQDRCQVVITSHSTEVLSHPLITPERTRLIVWRDGRSGVFDLDAGSRASAVPPDTVGSILRINGIYPAEEQTSSTTDLFALDDAP